MTEQPQPAPPAPPAPPANSVEARSRLDARVADKEWGAKVYAGDPAANRELRELQEMASRDDDAKIERAMQGGDAAADPKEREMACMAAIYREIGIREEVIKEDLSHKPISKAEHDLAAAWKKRHMADKDWANKYLSGDAEAREKLTLANMILNRPVEGDPYSGWMAAT